MRLRCLVKDGDGWRQEFPADYLRWLCEHDTIDHDALVIDDTAKTKQYYCNRPTLMESAKGEGKAAAMFYDLAVLLPAPPGDHLASPLWCAGHDVLCSEKPVCAADCR